MRNLLLLLFLSPMLSIAVDEGMKAWISENTLLASIGLAGGCMHASPIQAGRAFSGSRLYCTTQMQELRV
jgi:hypothetical protein